MIDQATKLKILNNPKYRRPYMAKNLYRYARFYFRHYFTFTTPDFLLPVYKAMQSGRNVYMKMFRGSSKTTSAQIYANYAISQRIRRYIMRYSETGDSSEENLMYVANGLIENERFISDYGQLYYDENANRYGSKTIKGKKKFKTENDILLAGMSMRMSPRGKNFTARDGKYRPDLIFMDDVDTLTSVRNKTQIDKNREFFTNEIMGGTTSHTQFVVMGNTIYEDGMIPRMEEHFEGDKDRDMFVQGIYDENRKIVWNKFVETDAEADEINQGIRNPHLKVVSLETELRRLGSISYGQNYLLQPYVRGMVIVPRHLIVKRDLTGRTFDKIRIGIDTAISKKEGSDRVGMTVTGWFEGRKYIIHSLKLEGQAKSMPNQIAVAKQLYEKYGALTDNIALNVETVAFQEVLADYLKGENMAVNQIKTHKDKITRAIERQGDFESGGVFFNTTGCDDLIDEIIEFPNGPFDDMFDSMLMSFEDVEREIYV